MGAQVRTAALLLGPGTGTGPERRGGGRGRGSFCHSESERGFRLCPPTQKPNPLPSASFRGAPGCPTSTQEQLLEPLVGTAVWRNVQAWSLGRPPPARMPGSRGFSGPQQVTELRHPPSRFLLGLPAPDCLPPAETCVQLPGPWCLHSPASHL